MCGFHHENQSGLELKIVLPIENGEEPKNFSPNLLQPKKSQTQLPKNNRRVARMIKDHIASLLNIEIEDFEIVLLSRRSRAFKAYELFGEKSGEVKC
jgi:hypothetical protein